MGPGGSWKSQDLLYFFIQFLYLWTQDSLKCGLFYKRHDLRVDSRPYRCYIKLHSQILIIFYEIVFSGNSSFFLKQWIEFQKAIFFMENIKDWKKYCKCQLAMILKRHWKVKNTYLPIHLIKIDSLFVWIKISRCNPSFWSVSIDS